MEVTHIQKGDSHYPPELVACLGEEAPLTLSCIGNLELLRSQSLALFCSNKCPGSLILQTYDLAQRLREQGTSVISGFHSPVERECLNILLRGQNQIIFCPARGLEAMRIPKEYQTPLDERRLLMLSPFSKKVRRADGRTAANRNAVVAAIAAQLFIAHAELGSKSEGLCQSAISWGKAILTLEDKSNANLLALGAKTFERLRDLHNSKDRYSTA